MKKNNLRISILQQAIEGKLVPQLAADGNAQDLVDNIREHKAELIREKKLKKDPNESYIYRDDEGHFMERIGKKEPVCIDDDLPFAVPDGWTWARLGSIFTLQAGKNIFTESIKAEPFKGSYPCYGGNGLRGYVNIYNTEGEHPLIGRQGALCGNVNFAKGKFYATEHAVVVDTYCDTNIHWSIYVLIQLNLNQYATATAQPGLAVGKINTIFLPLPPLAEQARIVKKVEELMEKVDKMEKAMV